MDSQRMGWEKIWEQSQREGRDQGSAREPAHADRPCINCQSGSRQRANRSNRQKTIGELKKA